MLARFENNDGLELVIDNETGECFASMSASARMCDCSVTAIRRLIGDTESLRVASLNTSNGVKEMKLLDEGQILKVLAKYNSDLLLIFAQAGLRVYLHQLAGFEVKSTAVAVQKETAASKVLPSAIEYAQTVIQLHSSSVPSALKQLLLDKIGDELCTGQKQITSSTEPLKMGVAQRAEELGYKIDRSNRLKLGKFMAAQGLPLFKEKRLCEGTLRPINVYEVTPELDNLIAVYFEN